MKVQTLVGTWVNGDEYATDVEYQVSPAGEHGKRVTVRAIDRFDGEEGEVYDIKWDGEALTFATHWPSTGRFVKCRLFAISTNRVDFTYTYTQQEMWHRREAEPPSTPTRGKVVRRRVRKPRRGGSQRAQRLGR